MAYSEKQGRFFLLAIIPQNAGHHKFNTWIVTLRGTHPKEIKRLIVKTSPCIDDSIVSLFPAVFLRLSSRGCEQV
jgi:hypothetical protein